MDVITNKPKEPFFMAVGFFRPHVPLYASRKWFDLYPEESIVLPPIRRDDRNDTPRFSWYTRRYTEVTWAICSLLLVNRSTK